MPKQCGFNNWEAALILSQLDLYPIWDGPLKWTWPFMRQVACHHTSVIRRPLRLTVVSRSSVSLNLILKVSILFVIQWEGRIGRIGAAGSRVELQMLIFNGEHKGQVLIGLHEEF